MPVNSPEATFIINNAVLAARLSKKVGNRLSVHGISLTEYLIMSYLGKTPHNAVPRIELADYMGMSASGITRLLLPMEKNRLINKITNPRDARQSLVGLSKAGTQVFQESHVSFEHIASDLLAKLGQAKLAKSVETFTFLL